MCYVLHTNCQYKMILFILAAASIGACLAQCPDTFERHSNVCYKVVAIKANWIDSRALILYEHRCVKTNQTLGVCDQYRARPACTFVQSDQDPYCSFSDITDVMEVDYCNLFGGELLRIETGHEQKIIDGILTRVHGSISDEIYWINGGDMLSENEFRWFFENGHSEVIPHDGYTNFSPGQPDNAGSVEHCIEIVFNEHKAQWNDRNCDAVRNFICEAKFGVQTEIVG